MPDQKIKVYTVDGVSLLLDVGATFKETYNKVRFNINWQTVHKQIDVEIKDVETLLSILHAVLLDEKARRAFSSARRYG